jgi:hemolysin III
MTASALPGPTVAEEIVHAATHGVGAVFSFGALVLLVASAAVSGSVEAIVAAAVFGTSLCLVYLSSTVYHAVPPRWPGLKALLQILDHAAIHLLIAGTLTPFALCAIGGAWGYGLLAASWTFALLGIVVETTALRHRARLSISLYVGSGWFGLAVLPFLWTTVPASALWLLASGGVAYTAGVPFFLAHTRRWTHALWHGFVLVGSALHVAAIAVILSP